MGPGYAARFVRIHHELHVALGADHDGAALVNGRRHDVQQPLDPAVEEPARCRGRVLHHFIKLKSFFFTLTNNLKLSNQHEHSVGDVLLNCIPLIQSFNVSLIPDIDIVFSTGLF